MGTRTPEPPTNAKRSAMQAQREQNTKPEVSLRRELHSRGLRYRIHRPVIPGLRRELDIVFGRAMVAVEVRGCFWHSCPVHATQPKANAQWWTEKLARNVARDEDTERRLASAGWQLIVVWEHDDPIAAAAEIQRCVLERHQP